MQSEYKEKQEVSKRYSKAWASSVVPHVSLSRRVSPFLAWGDFHARSAIPKEKWGTTRSLTVSTRRKCHKVKKPFSRQIDFQIWDCGS